MPKKLFSTELEEWLNNKRPKTVDELNNMFAQRSFAAVFLVLMAFPSIPIPTGGITHVLEIIVMILAIELIVGRKTIWLPKRLKNKNLGQLALKKIIPFALARVKWFEKHSSPTGSKLLANPYTTSVIGIFVFVFTLTAFLAPPFTGLDTFPAFAVFVIALSILLNDIKLTVVGVILGLASLSALVFFGSIIVDFIHNLYHRII